LKEERLSVFETIENVGKKKNLKSAGKQQVVGGEPRSNRRGSFIYSITFITNQSIGCEDVYVNVIFVNP